MSAVWETQPKQSLKNTLKRRKKDLLNDPAQLLRKKVSSTRTYKYRIYDDLAEPFKQVQTVRRLYFNYALKYLYQHYGSKHLDHYLPSGKKRQYLIRNLVEFARKKVRVHGIDLKKIDYSVQSVDKMISELLVAFEKYRRQQYGINTGLKRTN